MEKREKIEHLAGSRDEEILLARVYDRMTAAQQRNIPASTCFLTKREQLLAGQLLPELTLTFFGGAEACERAVCCWLPDYLDESWLSSGDGPVAAVRAEFYAQDTLSHRDFLGSLMGSGIKRETVGDIFAGEGQLRLLRDARDPALRAAESRVRRPHEAAPCARSRSRRSACRRPSSKPSATPSRPCGSTASCPRASDSAGARRPPPWRAASWS
jgi:hypothetical protein